MTENSKILTFPLSDNHNCACPNCRQLEFRLQRSLKLHAETTVLLAQCETQLVEAKRQLRELKGGAS